MLAFIVSFTLYALRASALNQGLPSFGPEKAGFGDTPEALKIIEEAGRDPNATSSGTIVTEKHFDRGDQSWTWRVNVTELAVPNRVDDLGESSADFSEGLYVANTQWQLDWTGDADSLPDFLRKEKIVEISFAALTTNQPSKNTEKYNDDDEGDCTPILGEKCVDSMIDTAQRDSISFSELDGCEDTLSVNYDGGVGFTVAPEIEDSDVKETLNRSDTFFYRTSEPYTKDNSTLFNRSLSALQILVMDVRYDVDGINQSRAPAVFCKIVDKSAQEDTEEDEDDDEDGAMNWHHSTSGLWILIILSILVVL